MAKVTGRARHSTTRNWKVLRRFLWSSPQLFFRETPDFCLELGPLSVLMVQSQRAVLLRLIPRFAEQTDFELIEMVKATAPEPVSRGPAADAVEDGLRRTENSAHWFDCRFADWYWSLMSAA